MVRPCSTSCLVVLAPNHVEVLGHTKSSSRQFSFLELQSFAETAEEDISQRLYNQSTLPLSLRNRWISEILWGERFNQCSFFEARMLALPLKRGCISGFLSAMSSPKISQEPRS